MRFSLKLPLLYLVVLLFILASMPAFAAGKAPVNAAKDKDNEKIITTAQRYLKTPYRFGGDSPKGFDCSGFVKFVYEQNGKKLPRAADVQYLTGKKVERAALVRGDLVFFNTYASGASHVGIYYGGGKFIHASSSKGVMISGLDEAYWKPRYLGARRVSGN